MVTLTLDEIKGDFYPGYHFQISGTSLYTKVILRIEQPISPGYEAPKYPLLWYYREYSFLGGEFTIIDELPGDMPTDLDYNFVISNPKPPEGDGETLIATKKITLPPTVEPKVPAKTPIEIDLEDRTTKGEDRLIIASPKEIDAPWYLAWLKPLADWWGAVVEAWTNYWGDKFDRFETETAEINEKLGSTESSISQFVKDPVGWVVGGLIGIITSNKEISENIITETEAALVKESLDPDKFKTSEFRQAAIEIREKMTGTPQSMVEFVDSTINVPIKTLGDELRKFVIPDKPLTFDEAKEQQLKIFALYVDFITLGMIIDILATAISATLIRNIAQHIRSVITVFNAGDVMKSILEPALTIGITRPLEYGYEEQYMNQILSPQDLIEAVVKEKLTLDDFKKFMRMRGYNDTQSQLIWDKHFIPPTLSDILTAWRRGLIDEKRVDDLMILVDLDPAFKEVFDTRKYIDPSMTVARFMFETGTIDKDTVKEIVKRTGLTPAYTDNVTDFITGFQARFWRRRYLIQLTRGYEVDIVPEEELRSAVKDAYYTDEVANWIIKTSDLRKRLKGARLRTKIFTRKEIKKLLDAGEITEDEYREKLLYMGYDEGDLDFVEALDRLEFE